VVVTLKANTNEDSVLKQAPVIYVKRKTGFLPYAEDPRGFRSILSRSFPKNRIVPRSVLTSKKKSRAEFVQAFSADPSVLAFASHFCSDDVEDATSIATNTFCTTMLYECLTHEKPEILNACLTLWNATRGLNAQTSSLSLSDLRLLLTYYECRSSPTTNFDDVGDGEHIIQASFVELLRSKLELFFSKEGKFSETLNTNTSSVLSNYLRSYHFPQQTTQGNLFGCYLSYYSIPTPHQLNQARMFLTSNINSNNNTTLFHRDQSFVPILGLLFGRTSGNDIYMLSKVAYCW